MELTLRTIVVMIIILVTAVVLITIILGWGGQANAWFSDVMKPFQDLLLGR